MCRRLQDGTCKYVHDTKKKGVNAPTKAVRAAADGKSKDFTGLKCNVCNVTGHSHNWANCPSKLSANKVLHAAPASTAASATSVSSKTPSILPLQDVMTVSERALHGYNNKLMKILNVFATQANQQRGGAYPSLSNPLMDPVAMMQAFSGRDDDE
jgi:hypothetical protein